MQYKHLSIRELISDCLYGLVTVTVFLGNSLSFSAKT